MSVGLIGLLDDIAAIAKMAAASLDDVASQAAKAGTKAAGVVIDDTAVTPNYVIGFASKRELPIVGKIAVGSLRNKLLILLPIAMLLGYFLPAAVTPLPQVVTTGRSRSITSSPGPAGIARPRSPASAAAASKAATCASPGPGC